MKEKKCLYCQKLILMGRSDKKFCNPTCRHAHNNEILNQRYFTKSMHEKIIHKNYKILRKLCPHGKGTVRRTTVEELGFDFKFFTSFYRTQKHKTYFFCFDLGYTPIMDNGHEKLLIVSWQKYMDNFDFDPWKGIR
ncbi:hypothetical protein [Flammeovirga sp. EKP202]|uniref:hypothetical protein n=1 Tax=Flammeovirga sp. EKP202 TaxID=2770592 RepID=UPI00165FF5FE|nr:hypothetical protein [Flammeovirga sp. EKP202]MBD0405237.1 hypothetical protein [Flammeovirga sp. EKP202]